MKTISGSDVKGRVWMWKIKQTSGQKELEWNVRRAFAESSLMKQAANARTASCQMTISRHLSW